MPVFVRAVCGLSDTDSCNIRVRVLDARRVSCNMCVVQMQIPSRVDPLRACMCSFQCIGCMWAQVRFLDCCITVSSTLFVFTLKSQFSN